MRWVAPGLVVGIFAWLLAGPASAQHAPPPLPPADAPVVASAMGAMLVAFDHGGELCIGLRGHGPASCDAPPHGLFDPLVEGSGVAGRQFMYGVTTTNATSVDVLAPGARATAPVTGGAYVGRFAGQVRFFLVAVTAQPYRVLLRDAQGRVVGGTDLGPTPAIGHPVNLANGRTGATPWRASAYQTTRLRPSPLDRSRTERLTCVRIVFATQRPLDGGCSGPSPDPAGVTLSPREQCDPAALPLAGLAGPDVRAIDAVLGDGSRRRVPLYELPARFGGSGHAFVLVLPPGIAVRALRLHDAGSVRLLPLGQAPGGATCTSHLGVAQGQLILGLGFEPSHGSSSGPIVARDQGDLLCVGLGTITATDCQVPPIDPLLSRIETRGSGAQRTLLAVVPPDVAALRLTLGRGAPITVATTDLPGYAGIYAGLVRTASVALPAGAKVYDTDELAADGHVLQRVSGPDLRQLAHTPAVLARLPGGVVAAGGGACAQVGTQVPSRDRTQCRNLDFLPTYIAAPCAARRIVVIARARRLRIVTDRGVIGGRRKGRFTVAIVPRDAAVRSPVRLPPAAKQCGYALQT